jgi:hypothetical protein
MKHDKVGDMEDSSKAHTIVSLASRNDNDQRRLNMLKQHILSSQAEIAVTEDQMWSRNERICELAQRHADAKRPESLNGPEADHGEVKPEPEHEIGASGTEEQPGRERTQARRDEDVVGDQERLKLQQTERYDGRPSIRTSYHVSMRITIQLLAQTTVRLYLDYTPS